MAQITDIQRCAGLNHVHLTIQRTAGGTFQRTYEIQELLEPPPDSEQYVEQRLKLLVREAKAAGNNNYDSIRTYLLGREFVE